jgi:UDP-N-acetylglucosamine---dolichyl-phosphate N-acetylglucosaminyltransferase
MKVGRIAVVLPAYNEAAKIRDVLDGIPAYIRSIPVSTIVVDDGSSDGTAEIASSCDVYVVRHLINLGVGAATQTGLRAAQMIDADIIVTMDADGQHDPAEIERLVCCLMDYSYDVVIGSRLLNPNGMPVSRIAANLLLNAITFVVYRKIVSDSQSGFKAFSRAAVDQLELRSSGYEVCSEIIGQIYRKNFCYKSLPVRAVYTSYSLAKGQHFLNAVNLILGLFARWMRRV